MKHLPGPRGFATTHWSLVVAAKPDEASQTRARRALAETVGNEGDLDDEMRYLVAVLRKR